MRSVPRSGTNKVAEGGAALPLLVLELGGVLLVGDLQVAGVQHGLAPPLQLVHKIDAINI